MIQPDEQSAVSEPQAAGSAHGSVNINLLGPAFVLARNWKMIIAVPFTVAVVTALLTLCIANTYTAKAMILPGEESTGGMLNVMMSQMGGLAGLAGDFGGATKADLYVTMLKSEALKDQIIRRFNLVRVYGAKYRVEAYAELDESVSISAGKKDGVITIATSAKDPALAAAIANGYIDELGKMTAKISMDGAGKSRIFLQDRLARAKADLAAAEEALKSFQSSKKVMDVSDQAKATLENVAQLRARLVAEEVQLTALRERFSDESHEMRSAKATVAGLRRELQKVEGPQVGDSMPSVGAMPKLGQEYVRLMRDFKIQETLVELLTKQYEMTKITEAKDVAPFHVLQTASPPELKSKPKRAVIVLLAAFLAGFATVIFAFAREYFTNLNSAERKQWLELRRMLTLR